MTADPILLLAWLVLGHLTADFVLQTSRIAVDKTGHGQPARRALADHGLGVAVPLLLVVAAFGGPGLATLALVVVSHVVIDRTKIVLTRSAEARALAEAHRRHELAGATVAGLGAAWTPIPAALFGLDQLVHLSISAFAWAVWLAPSPLGDSWRAGVSLLIGGWDPQIVHRVTLTVVVGLSLLIVNVRAASLFVAVLVNPREVEAPEPALDTLEAEAAAEAVDRAAEADEDAGVERGGLRFRLGPLEIRSGADSAIARRRDRVGQGGARALRPAQIGPPPPARIGEAIGVLERLLIVVFVLTGAIAAIGFVVAAKTLARFKQLDDRAFAEYYLLGTLASVTVALISSLLAAAALGL